MNIAVALTCMAVIAISLIVFAAGAWHYKRQALCERKWREFAEQELDARNRLYCSLLVTYNQQCSAIDELTNRLDNSLCELNKAHLDAELGTREVEAWMKWEHEA